jgi:DNA-binding NarL/FixJ family response regulator
MTSLMTPSEEQARIVQAHHTGLSVGQIADNFHRSDMTIARIVSSTPTE